MQDAGMATRITFRGQVTVPKQIREALRLEPGDAVEFDVNAAGEVVLRKLVANATAASSSARQLHPRADAQMQRRAAELLALLRGLD
jgi:AbrB family looped-hinge helix DNA binding protein